MKVAGVVTPKPGTGTATFLGKRRRLTEKEAREREERLRAAGITVLDSTPETTIYMLQTRKPENPLENDGGSGVVE